MTESIVGKIIDIRQSLRKKTSFRIKIDKQPLLTEIHWHLIGGCFQKKLVVLFSTNFEGEKKKPIRYYAKLETIFDGYQCTRDGWKGSLGVRKDVIYKRLMALITLPQEYVVPSEIEKSGLAHDILEAIGALKRFAPIHVCDII